MTQSIQCGDDTVYYKLTNRAQQNFRDLIKKEEADLATIFETDPLNSAAKMAMFAIQAGYRVEGKTCPFQTVEQVFALDEKYDIILKVCTQESEDEKKPTASLTGMQTTK